MDARQVRIDLRFHAVDPIREAAQAHLLARQALGNFLGLDVAALDFLGFELRSRIGHFLFDPFGKALLQHSEVLRLWTEHLFHNLARVNLLRAIIKGGQMSQAGVQPAGGAQGASRLRDVAHPATLAIGLAIPTGGDNQPLAQPASHAPGIRVSGRIVKPIHGVARLGYELYSRFSLA